MADGVTPSQWAVERFGEQAAEVTKRVVTGLARGQRSARLVQVAAKNAGAKDKRPYGSMWATRYSQVIEQFDLADMPGYEARKPKGASYSLAVINGCVLIPFRHATSLKEPISSAKLSTKIPKQVSRDNGVEPAQTLFDVLGSSEVVTDPSVADAASAARAEKLTVVYIAYVANSDSDEVLGAWWGTPNSLEDDGTMSWSPERLDMSIAVAQSSSDARGSLHGAGTDIPTRGFAEGAIPSLVVTPRSEVAHRPSAEREPAIPEAEDSNE